MRYFSYLTEEEEHTFFHSLPLHFNNHADRNILAHAVGSALYMPATRDRIADDLAAGRYEGLVSIVLDLEDAVGDNMVHLAEETLWNTLRTIELYVDTGVLDQERVPLIFIRVRSPEQLERLFLIGGTAFKHVTGFVFPKFNAGVGSAYFRLLAAFNEGDNAVSHKLYGMPILESNEIIYRETRLSALLSVRELLDEYKPYVLNVRIGATDFSSLFGLRRSPDSTIYDIAVIRDCIADIVNIFGRVDNHYVISGPVWEYFKSDRVLKPQLRQTPFEESMGRSGRKLRMSYINRYVDGLMREVSLDKENGIIGKTIIHPTHIKPVQALYVVTHEEYQDALHIMEHNHGNLGVMKSRYSNKMNEIKPHLNWAERIIMRSTIYGVLHENQNFTCLLSEEREPAII